MGTCNEDKNCSPVPGCSECYPVSKLGIPASAYAEMAQPVVGIQADGCLEALDVADFGAGSGTAQTEAPITGDGTTGDKIRIQDGTDLFDVAYYDPSGSGQWQVGRPAQALQAAVSLELSGLAGFDLYARVSFKRMLGHAVAVNIALFNTGASTITLPQTAWFDVPGLLANIFPDYNPATAPTPPSNGGILFDYAATDMPGIYQFPFVAVETNTFESTQINGFFSKRTDFPLGSPFYLNRLVLSYLGGGGITLVAGDYISGNALIPIREDTDW